jgi:hypothetical protein
MQVPFVTMSRPSLRTAAPLPCLPLGIKDSLKEDARLFGCWRLLSKEGFLMGGFLTEEKLLEGDC